MNKNHKKKAIDDKLHDVEEILNKKVKNRERQHLKRKIVDKADAIQPKRQKENVSWKWLICIYWID